MYIQLQSFLSFRHVSACGSLFQGRSRSAIVKGKVFEREGMRSWSWPKRLLGLSTWRPNCKGHTAVQGTENLDSKGVFSAVLFTFNPQRVGVVVKGTRGGE